ncbi:hypothetical protein HK098_002892 [Nowakowskiella sp. JEL0407]|nr:hypothetical protein HK098_002892 [Nowakowskiella sp. JEL0407]
MLGHFLLVVLQEMVVLALVAAADALPHSRLAEGTRAKTRHIPPLMNKFVKKAVLLDGNSEEVRTAQDIVPVNEAYDPRPLYERLQENKNKKDEEFAEKLKLGNRIKRLDEDEIAFLTQLDSSKRDANLQIEKQVKEELEGYEKSQREAMQTQSHKPIVVDSTVGELFSKEKADNKSKASKKKTLAGVVVKKRKNEDAEKKPDKVIDSETLSQEIKKVKQSPPPDTNSSNESVSGLLVNYPDSDSD